MDSLKIEEQVKKLAALKTDGMYQDNFLLTWERSDDEIAAVFQTAEFLENMRKMNISGKSFDSGLAVSLFRDNSTRTGFSFSSAANLPGLSVQDLDEGKSQIAHGETVRETANMVSFMADVIGIRDDMYIGKGNSYMREVSEAVKQGYEAGIKDLEKELLAQNACFKDWECTEELMSLTKDKKALYMHCLPADITGVSCEQGEVEATVFDRYREPLYKEASFKPYVIAAMIFLSRFSDPADKLLYLVNRGQKHIF